MSLKLLIPAGLLAALMMLDPVARAVGLGPVDVESSLNEPLRAEIPLLSVGGMDVDQVEVGLASPEDFARVGINRPSVLERLEFTLGEAAGQPVILVTSEQPVTEPFLSFLVRVSWPQGRLLREYTILLDPPVTAPASAAAPEQPRERRVERGEPAEDAAPARREPAPAEQQVPSRPAGERAAPAAGAGGQYGPVASGETLWRIANQTRPDSAIGVNQMMLALLRTNPDAFFRDNINALKRGAVLRVPDRGEIERLTAAEALSAVRRQNELWQDYRRNLAQDAPSVVAGGEPQQRAQEPAREEETDSRLELVPPREGEAPAETARAGTGAGTGQQAGREDLRQELARTREELLAKREQTDQLDGRVSELEAQVERLQRLLELKNEELAAIQAQGGQEQAPGDQAPADDTGAAGPEAQQADTGLAAEEESAPGERVDQAAGTAPGAEQAEEPGPAESQAQAAAEEEAEPAPDTVQPPPAPAERGWMEILLSPVVLGVAGLLLIGIGVALFLHRRGSGLAEPTTQRESLGPRMAGTWEREEEATRSAESAEEATAEEATDEDAFGPPEAGPADYDEAALRAALEEDPADTDTRLKLIRHYAATNQREAFIAQAETLYAELADPAAPAWLETRQLGEEIAPDHALFGGSEEDVRSTVTDAEPGEAGAEETQPAEPEAPEEPPSPREEARSGEREPGAGLPDLEFESPAEEESARTGEPEEEPAGETGEFAEGREYDLSDLEDESAPADEETPGETKRDEAGEPGVPESRGESDEQFDFGDMAESREREDQEPLEFDLSDFESEAESGDEAEIDEDRPGGTPTTEMEAPPEAGTEPVGEDETTGEQAAPSGDTEGVDTKLELAEAYLDMGDEEGAREMLEEVMGEGSEDQKKRAREMLDKL